MRHATRRVVAVSFVVFGLWFSLYAQSPTKTAKVPPATISGKVTIKGKPAAGVVVAIRKPSSSGQPEPPPRATTDRDGVYRITNVLAGSYEVTPSAPAYIVTELPNNAGSKLIVISEGENVEGINFSLVRGGVITGKITDADGRPSIQQQVNLFRSDAFNPPSQSQPPRPPGRVNSASTDDRGIYRIFGLAAGRYKVAVGRVEGMYGGALRSGTNAFSPVFYPDATDPLKAAIVEVTEGGETANIDIALGRQLQTFSASGRVEDEEGKPLPAVQFGVQRISSAGADFISDVLTTNPNGEFFLEGLLPGKYTVFMFNQGTQGFRSDALGFEIVDQNVSGVTIKVSKGATISGVVVLESDNKLAAAKLSQLMLRGSVRSPTGPMGLGGASSRIGSDGSFRLTGLPAGTAFINLSGTSESQFNGLAISRIERDGIVSPNGIELKDREEVTGLRIFLSFGNATLRGVVNIENGPLPGGGNIMIRLMRPGEPESQRMGRVDSRGHFIMEWLPSGVYEVSAIVFVPGTRPGLPVKEQVSLNDGATVEVVLTVNLAPRQPEE